MTSSIDSDRAVRLLLVGAGGMGRRWVRAVASVPGAELAAIADLDSAAAAEAAALAAELGLGQVPTGSGVSDLAADTGADAVLDVTVPPAHHPVTTEALFAGLPVLGEKPAAQTVAETLSLAAASEATGKLFMVSQSRRYNRKFTRLRSLASELGRIGSVTHTFAKAPRFGGFREAMAQPLLVDMAIHQFDMSRALLGGDPVSVYCESYNPPWSWYDGDAAANAVFVFEDGVRFSYSGSWCAPGDETSWNGDWRVSAAEGTARWDGDHQPTALRGDGSVVETPGPEDGAEDVEGALTEFVAALRDGSVPQGEVHDNVVSLAMVEAAVLSADSKVPVRIADVLERAHQEALAAETREEVRARLREWSTPVGERPQA